VLARIDAFFCATDQAASATVQRDVEIDFGSRFGIIADR
jgi:hypothetical protein